MEDILSLELLQFLGPGGAAAMLAMFMADRRAKPGPGEALTQAQLKEVLTPLARLTEELHGWHNKEDEDGVKVWYVRRSLEKAIVQLGAAVEHLSRNQDRLTDLLERQLDEKA